VSHPGELFAIGASEESRTRWPHRLSELVGRWFGAPDPKASAVFRNDAWILLYGIVAASVRSRARGVGSIAADDQRDIAAQKVLDLMRRLDERAWDPSRAAPEQVRAYVVSAARHAVVDFARSRALEGAGADGAEAPERATAPTQEQTLDGRTCAAAIVACLSRLAARTKAAWCLRVLLELSSEQIARHPSIGMTPGAVDVMLFRVREAMRKCLASRGVDPATLPPGTYVHLWESIAGGQE